MLDLSSKEYLGMLLAPWLSPLSPANPHLEQDVHRPRGEVCPHLGKAWMKGRGGVILEVNGQIDL